VAQEIGCKAFLAHHPDIQQEPLLQSTTDVDQRQTVPADHVADDPVPCDLVAFDPVAEGTWLVITELCGCSGSTAVACWLSVPLLVAACVAGAAKMHIRHYMLSQKTQSQTCKCTNTERL